MTSPEKDSFTRRTFSTIIGKAAAYDKLLVFISGMINNTDRHIRREVL